MTTYPHPRPLSDPPPTRPPGGIRPPVTRRGREVAERSAAERRALMGTIGRPFS